MVGDVGQSGALETLTTNSAGHLWTSLDISTLWSSDRKQPESSEDNES